MFTVQPLVMALPTDYRTSPKLATGSNRGVAGHNEKSGTEREIRDGGAIRLHAFRK